jgi:hypothetical protein
MQCEAVFGIITQRRHHCRLCGRLFCDLCSSERRRVPELLRHRLPQPPSAAAAAPVPVPMRVCRACASHLDVHVDAEAWVERCRRNPFLTIREWRVLGCCASVLARATSMLLTVWRRVPYSLPWTVINDDERTMLRANRHLLAGHARATMLAQLAGFSVPSSSNRVSCQSLGCYRYCTRHLRTGDAVEILTRLPYDMDARSLAMDSLVRAPERLKPYVGAMLNIGTRDPSFVHVVLCKLVASTDAMAHHVIWRAWSHGHDAIAACLLHSLDPAVRAEVEESRAWSQDLEATLRGEHSGVGAQVYLPGLRKMLVRRVLVAQAYTIHDSASRPTVVPVVLQEDGGEDRVHHLLYKADQSVCRDMAAMDSTKMLGDAFAAETGRPVPSVLYHTVQLLRGGLVLMVPGTQSLSKIRQSGMSLLNFLIENNPTVRSGVLRDTFVRSCAFSSVLCLLCGVGDRHLDNIMVRVCSPEGGVLFHIDYEFMLGSEPAHRALSRAAVPRLRITGSIEDALGGSQSHDFALFRETCAGFMAIAMRHARELFYILHGNDVGSPERIEDHLRSWMMSCEPNEATVQLRIDQVVRQATRYRTIDSVLERLHSLSGGIRTTLGNLVGR